MILGLIVAIIYGISPVDIIPDFIPVVGVLDDIVVAFISLALGAVAEE